jgi:hypothetical protein
VPASGRAKGNAAIAMSILAFALSLFATVRTEWRAADDKRRAVRTQLTDVLARLTSLQLENAKLVHAAQGDQPYLQAIGSALNLLAALEAARDPGSTAPPTAGPDGLGAEPARP